MRNSRFDKDIAIIPLETNSHQLLAYAKKLQTALTLSDLKLKINLGVTAKERRKKQTVWVTIKINFSHLPLACETGNIADTVCYDTLTQKIKKFCQQREFTLIETLGTELFMLVKEFGVKKSKIYIRVEKPLPVVGLTCSIFEIQD